MLSFLLTELLEQLAKQEVYDTEKFRAALESSANNNANQGRNRTGMTPEPGFFKSTLTLAERKRLEWQQEKGLFLFIHFSCLLFYVESFIFFNGICVKQKRDSL